MSSANIRNFAIIAHVDHGKSTLSDRLMELTGAVPKRQMQDQLLDSNPIERERGVTIKLAPVTMKYRSPSSFFLLPSSFTLDGLAARVFQHEIDHLNGILFTDHVLAQGNQIYREEGKELVEMAM